MEFALRFWRTFLLVLGVILTCLGIALLITTFKAFKELGDWSPTLVNSATGASMITFLGTFGLGFYIKEQVEVYKADSSLLGHK